MANANQNFKDIPKNAEYIEHLKFVNDKNFISGYQKADGLYFDPDGVVKRSHVAKILLEATGTPIHGSAKQFNDLPNNQKYKEAHTYLSKAVELGWLSPDSNNNIRAFDPINRAEMAYAVSKAFKLDRTISSKYPYPFNDAGSLSSPAKEAINSLYYTGVVRGENQMYKPYSNLKRNQFIMMVGRAMNQQFKLANEFTADFATGEAFNLGNSTLNIRQLANAKSSSIGKVSQGENVQVLAETSNGWLKIRLVSGHGYVSKAYIKASSDSNGNVSPPEVESPTPLNSDTIATTTILPSVIYSQKSSQSKSLTTIRIAQSFEVLAIENNWVKIRIPKIGEGYILKENVKLTNKKGNPVKDRIIVLDPGHGGNDSGAVSNGLQEKAVALSVAKKVESKLKKDGAKVIMTRTNDRRMELNERTAFAKKVHAESFISIHLNSATNSSAHGTETFYSSQVYAGDQNLNGYESKILATFVNSSIIKEVNTANRGVKDRAFYVIRKNNIPAILIELAFISNPTDRDKLKSEYYQEKFADAIYKGIVQYYKE